MVDYNSKDVTLDEIVFENRNRSYGAYDLRVRYPDHIKRSGFFVLFFAATVGLGSSVFAELTLDKVEPRPSPDIVVTVVLPPKTKKPDEALPGEKAAPHPKAVDKPAVAQNPTKVITTEPDDPELKDSLPKIDEPTPLLVDAGGTPGSSTAGGGGTEGGNSALPGGGEGGGGLGDAPNSDIEILPSAGIMPDPGYDYRNFIARRASFTQEALRNEISGIVYVQFVVEPTGAISNARVVKGIGYGCDEKALEAVRSMPDWQPGIQGKRKVRVQMTIPVNFQLR